MFLMFVSTHKRVQLSGTVVDWSTNGYYDVYYPDPSSDAHCSADDICSNNTSHASEYSCVLGY
jgi:hypothetical protein